LQITEILKLIRRELNGESMTAYTHDPASSLQSNAFGSNAKKFEDKRVPNSCSKRGQTLEGTCFFCETVWSHIPGSEPPVSVNHKMVL